MDTMDFSIQILVNKISSIEIVKTLAICTLLLAIHALFFFGLIQSLLIVASYIFGLYMLHFSMQYTRNVNDILSFLTRIVLQKCWPNFSADEDTEPQGTDKLNVPQNIDNALNQFMNRLVNHYLSHWYVNISEDLDFPYEVRLVIQNVVSNCYRRLSKVKADEFLFKKIFPICLNHVHSYNQLKTDANLSHLHIAVHSRTAELLYLQNISKNLMPFLVQSSELRCKSFSILLREILTRNFFLALSDTICFPENLNPILLHYLKGHYNFLSTECYEDAEKVPLLDKFVCTVKPQPLLSGLRPDLATILKEDDLKEAFMRYLRQKNADHMLQFCIDIEVFTDKLSQQNFDTEELDNLYRDAWDLYSVYFSSYSPNYIQFEEDYASTLRKALSKDISKLANTRTLSHAYNYVYLQLENQCYDFYSCNEFFFWLYGRSEPSELVRSSHETVLRVGCHSHWLRRAGIRAHVPCKSSVDSTPFTNTGSSQRVAVTTDSQDFPQQYIQLKDIAPPPRMLQLCDEVGSSGSGGGSTERKTGFELGSKLNIIKDALKPDQILEGQLQEKVDAENFMELGEDIRIAVPMNERNMNLWKISIPTVGSRLEAAKYKAHTVFVIQIQTESGEDWVVERRTNDFYSLDVKLTEFHGPLRDAQIPTRKLTTSQAELIQMYEEYLNKLVKIPALRNSELLSTFLSSVGDLEEEETSLGKLFRKSVVPTLRKERGQNLEAFISTYVSSCKMTKYEWKDVGEMKKAKESNSKSQIYENNFDVNPDISQQIFYTQGPPPPNDAVLEKPSTSLLYLGSRLYNLQNGTIKLLLALQSFFGGVIDQLIVHYVARFLGRVLNSTNIAYLINLTEKAIFASKHKKYNAEEIKIGLTETLDSLKNSWLHPLYVLLYENLQDGKLNKQLFYQLMDALIEELFPELNEAERS